MSAINFESLLNELSGVLYEEGFTVTPDQIVRAHAVLLRLGVDRSPSGLVSLLAPIFCTKPAQQDQFVGLFIQALDQSDPAKAGLTIGDGRLLVREVREEAEQAEPGSQKKKRYLPGFVRPVVGATIAALLGVMVYMRLSAAPEIPPPGSIPGLPSSTLQSKRDGVPKFLPRIEGRSRLDIQIDSSGRDTIPAAMAQKYPLPVYGLLAVTAAAVLALAGPIRKRWNGLSAPKKHTIRSLVPRQLPKAEGPEPASLYPEFGVGTEIDIVASIQEHARLGYWKELVRVRPVHPESYGTSRTAGVEPVNLLTAPVDGPGADGATTPRARNRHTFVEGIGTFWTRRHIGKIVAVAGTVCLGITGIVPFLPILSVKNDVHHVASKPIGVDFGDWICFTKIEQAIDWHLSQGTTIEKLTIDGYDQTASGEGFQLVSRSDPHVTIGPVTVVDGPMSNRASLVFEPLHAKEYTGLLRVQTNHGEISFGLRGTGVYGGDACVDEGHGQFGLESDFNGNGCNQIDLHNGSVSALLAPARPIGPSDTHSALVLGPWRQGEFELQCGIRTIAQLRDPIPNPWEVGWLIWNFSDLNHFYYLSLKANGWELGRKDPRFPGGVRFLATKNSPQFPPGQRYFVHLSRQGDLLTVDVNGKRLVSISDSDHPVSSGRIGFYSECADSKFDSLEIH